MFDVWCGLETLENTDLLPAYKQAQTAAPNTCSSPRGLARDSKPQQICSIMPLPPPLKFYILPLVVWPSLNSSFVWLGQKNSGWVSGVARALLCAALLTEQVGTDTAK